MTYQDFDPTTPEAEQIAYAAGLNLNNPPPDFDTPLPDGSTMRQKAATTFETWHDTRKAKGLPLFPSVSTQAAATRDAEFKKAYAGLDQLKTNLRPEQWQTLEAGSQGDNDPREWQARAINANFFRSQFGKDLPPEHLSQIRDIYATQELGITGPVTDKAVYEGIRQRYATDDADNSTVASYSKAVAGKMLERIGKLDTAAATPTNDQIQGFQRPGPKDLTHSPTAEEIDTALAGVSERNRPQARRQIMGQVNEMNRLFRRFGPTVDRIALTVDRITDGADQEAEILRQIDGLTAMLPSHPKERGVVLAMLSNKLDAMPQEKRDALARGMLAVNRGLNQAIESGTAYFREGARQIARSVPYGNPNTFPAIADDEMEFQTRRKELLNLVQGQGMSLDGAADGLLTQGLIKFGPSAWMIPAAFHPAGQSAIAATMAGESIGQDRIANPGTDEGLRFNAGTVSGIAQAGIETLANTTGAKVIAGKLPSLTGILNRTGVVSPLGRAALGTAAGGVAVAGMEYTEEILQGATDLALQGLASDLSGIRADIDWTGYLGSWLGRSKDEAGNWQWKLGEEQRDTLLAILPFALVGAGGAGLNHFRYGSGVVKSKSFLRAHGFTEPEIRSITATTDTAETEKAFRTAFEAAAAREPSLTTEERDTIAEHRAAALEELKAQNEVLSRAGLPRIEQETNTFTEQDHFIFIHPETDARQAFDTEEEALGEWWNWSRQQDQEHLDTIAEEGFIEHVTGEGMAAEDVNVEIKGTTLTLPKFQAEMQAEQATAEKDLAKASDPVQRRAAGERIAAAHTKLGWLKARIEAMILDEGLSPTQAGEAFKNTIVAGRVFATSVMGRIAGYTVQLFNGRNLQDVIEEFSEVNLRQALDGGLIDPEILQDDIRNFEKATGRQIMDPAYSYSPENPVKLIEGFSNLARAYAFSQVRTGTLPPTVARWVEMQTAAMSATVTAGNALSRDLATAGDLREALAAGNITPRLARTLADSIGLDPKAQERRLEKRMQEQLAAEAMENFPEIAEEARGKIPHPDTLRKENHPLAGEVRRLWESMVKPTRRRAKSGKSIDRTNEANAYFLPVGEMADLDQVRQRLNQKGFEFSTPTEMLDALDASLAYGKPFYGTASNLDEGAATYALTHKAIVRIEEAIAKKLTQGPDERAAFYERIRNRLAGTVLMLRETKGNTAVDASDVERETTRIRDAIAEARAVIDALPVEARGRVNLSFEDITNATTARGQANALIRLIQKADDVLETVLVQQYQEAFEKLADLAKPDLRQNKQLRGRLTPSTQRLVDRAVAASVIPPETLAGELIAKEAQIAALEAQPATTPEAIMAQSTQLADLYEELDMLNTFGALSTRDAAETAAAYMELLSIYTKGRTARKILDESRQQEINAAKREVLAGLPHVEQAKYADRAADKGIGDLAEAMRLGLSSFHQVMEHFFPNSKTARTMQERVRAADRAFTRAKIDAKDRFDRFTFAAFNLSGISARRKRNAILAKISTLRTDWNIQLAEGAAFEPVALSEEQATAILAGTMKVGWETDRIAMTSLAQALADFRLQRLKAQQEEKAFRSKVIRFSRLTKRGTPGPMHLSDLQALYYLQLWDQQQYRPALDKFGFTEAVIGQIRAKLDPRAEIVADFLRGEYDAQWGRLNPVYRSLYGMDMPRIRNYAPGHFESLDSKANAGLDELGQGGGQVNAMSAGFTKSRTHHMARPKLTNALTAYWSSQESTEYFIAYAEIVRDMRQIFRSPDLRYALEGNFGQRAAGVFSQWLDAIEVDGNFRAAQVKAMAEMVHSTLATQSAVGLAFNVGVLFKQLSASIGFLMEMPTKDAVHGLVKAIQDPASLRKVWESESIQQRVLAGISPEDRRLLDSATASPSILMDLLQAGRLPIAYADAVFTTLSGSVAYNHALAEARKNGIPASQAEAHALAVADRVITRTAQPAATQDKSLGELTANGFGKALFLFKSDPRQKIAMAAAAVQQFRAGKIGKGELGRRLFWGWAVYGLAAALAGDVFQSMTRDGDDPDRWSWKDYIAAMIAGPIAGVPFIGGVLEYVIRSTIGTKAFTNSANPLDAAAARLFSDKGIKSKVAKMITEDEPLTLRDILTGAQQDTAALSLLLGAIPGAEKLAIVPATLRVARDLAGAATNLADAVTEDTPEEKALQIAREAGETSSAIRTDRTEEIKRLAKELAALDSGARVALLENLDRDTRDAVTRRILRAFMSPSEQALAGLSKERRAAAVEQITAGLSETEKSAYLERLRAIRLAE